MQPPLRNFRSPDSPSIIRARDREFAWARVAYLVKMTPSSGPALFPDSCDGRAARHRGRGQDRLSAGRSIAERAAALRRQDGTCFDEEKPMEGQGRGKLLLVEDENLLRRLIGEFLRGEGFEVIEAADGLQGVGLFSGEGPFDVVLLDLNLPFLSGVEVCHRIKTQKPLQPVLICSGAILDNHISALQALNVEHFLTKPYHPLDLLDRIAIEMSRGLMKGCRPRSSDPHRLEPDGRNRLTAPPRGTRELIPWSSGSCWIKMISCSCACLSRYLRSCREDHTGIKRQSLVREGRFHGWETAESIGPPAAEGGR